MNKLFENITPNEINEKSIDGNPTNLNHQQKSFFSISSPRTPAPMKKNGLARIPVTSTAMIEPGNLAIEEKSIFRKALGKYSRTETLDPDRIDPHLFTLNDLPSPKAEQQYRRLAVNIITAAARYHLKRILLVSAHHGEGRTSVMLNLAGALAQAKLRILVVDSDFSRPSVMRLLGLDSEVGIAEVFASDKHIGEAAVTLRHLGITVLVTREAVDNPAEILASSEFHEMLNLLEPEFDFVLFDSPPLLDSADANLLTQIVDTTLMVVRPNTTTAAQMGKAVALLSQEDISGVVINRTTQN